MQLVLFSVVVLVFNVLLKVNSVLSNECPWSISDEDEATFVEFMDILESYTFPMCEDGNILVDAGIENKIWEERFALYDSHMNQTDGCLCKETAPEFQACMVEVRSSMSTRVEELINEIKVDVVDRCAT